MWWQEPRHLLPEVLEALDEGVMVIDRQGIIRIFNRAAARITGCPPAEAIGRLCGDVCRFSICEQCPVFRVFRDEALPAPDFQTDAPHSKHGRLIESHTVLLRDDQGQIVGAMEIMRDVTDQRLPVAAGERDHFLGLVGSSKAIQDIYRFIELVAPSDCTVVIQGETGTGKELIAEAIHRCSPRAGRPLVKVNCSALPEALLETELFGHVRGAFTDAADDKPGRFELADRGTLFLDEVGDLSPAVQLKLLRVLEHKEFERVGGVRTLKVDVRVIAATHCNLRELVARGRFRDDLFYRLHVVPIYVPPLRERRGDIPLLVQHFLDQARRRGGRVPRAIDGAALQLLMNHPWPGNIRELHNVLQYACVVCQGDRIQVADLSLALAHSSPRGASDPTERERILQALTQHQWRVKETAAALGMDRTTLWRKMKRYHIKRES